MHRDLYAAYPEMRQMQVEATKGGGYPYQPSGEYRNFASGRDAVGVNARSPDEFRDLALHEMQHGVQQREGFAPGGNPDNLRGIPQEERWKAARGAYEDSAGDNALLRELGVDVADVDLKPWDQMSKREQVGWLEAGRGRVYHQLAGEVEARNVQTRRDMTPEQRRATPPWKTQDVPDAQQIVNMGAGGGPQMSTSLPMDEASRLARAAKMGFDTKRPYYHGSSDGSITDVNPDLTKRGVYGNGFYTTRMAAKADGYAGPEGSVYPVYLKKDRVLDLTTPEGRAIYDAARGNGGNASLSESYDLIKAPGETVVLNGNAVRSKFAAFDPAKKDSSGLLASLVGAGLIPAGMLANGMTLDQMPQNTSQPAAFGFGPLPRKVY
jgi:hypothetical protein